MHDDAPHLALRRPILHRGTPPIYSCMTMPPSRAPALHPSSRDAAHLPCMTMHLYLVLLHSIIHRGTPLIYPCMTMPPSRASVLHHPSRDAAHLSLHDDALLWHSIIYRGTLSIFQPPVTTI
ncbi:hypothetical protein R3P38DRAFT_3212702 [Favolaschia claudopus]|uniref:Uncharacterized protein n=1 Tax=Favolaschia claudopus TaxID=2862362 RepID=A0AAW0AE81_9AGAR